MPAGSRVKWGVTESVGQSNGEHTRLACSAMRPRTAVADRPFVNFRYFKLPELWPPVFGQGAGDGTRWRVHSPLQITFFLSLGILAV